MMNLLIDSIEVFGQATLKTHSFLLKNLINIEFYYNLKMNIAVDHQKILIMFLVLMLVELVVQHRFVYLK